MKEKIEAIQNYLNENNLDGWLIYNFKRSNPVFSEFFKGAELLTRRSYFFIPKSGESALLVHKTDESQFNEYDFKKISYASWREMENKLEELLSDSKKIIMEVSSNCAIPTASFVDFGTHQLVSRYVDEIDSSKDIFQLIYASWSEEALNDHLNVAKLIHEICLNAFGLIGKEIKENGFSTEYGIQQYILEEFDRNKLITIECPVVAVNKNSGDPHYEPSEENNSKIVKGDWVLIDLWARKDNKNSVFADITWVAFVGDLIPEKYSDIFNIVKESRDLAIEKLKINRNNRSKIHGWELDDVVRNHIKEKGYGDNFLHRTGHSLAPGKEVHALGVNIDNYETHDNRMIIPGVGFSIEPGIYLKDFGIRSEIDVYIDPKQGPVITTPMQNEIVLIDVSS